jgi:hypothetical protein
VAGYKNSEPKNLFSLWSQVRVLWLIVWWPLKAYMIVNFRTHGISRGARKLVRIPTLIKKRKRDWTWKHLGAIDGLKWGILTSFNKISLISFDCSAIFLIPPLQSFYRVENWACHSCFKSRIDFLALSRGKLQANI